MFEGKPRIDFERVKQKFDSRHAGKSHVSSNSKNSSRKSDRHSSSQRIARSSEMNFEECKNNMNIHESGPLFDCEPIISKSGFQNQIQAQTSLEKEDNTVDLACSFNLDGFKVSDDDDVSSSFGYNNCMWNIVTLNYDYPGRHPTYHAFNFFLDFINTNLTEAMIRCHKQSCNLDVKREN